MKEDYQPIVNNEECERMLAGTYQGTLATCSGDEPYAVPLNHAYRDGRFYFHCATTGRKLDMIRRNPNVVYVVQKYYGSEEDRPKSLKCHGPWESVIAYGRARVVKERDELRESFRALMAYHGTDDYEPSESTYNNTRAIVIEVDYMTARREREESKTEFWEWRKA